MKKGLVADLDSGEQETVVLDFPITQAQVQGFDPADGTIFLAGLFAIPSGVLKVFEGYGIKLKLLGPNGQPPVPPLDEILAHPPMVRMVVHQDALTPQAGAEVVNDFLQSRAAEATAEKESGEGKS